MSHIRINLSYDDEKHPLVHLGLKNHKEPSDSAYMRKCIEFYELNKGGAINSQLVLEHLLEIRRMLQQGVVVASGDVEQTDAKNDQILDDLLEQLE